MHKYLGDMPREIMEYLPEIDYASCMLAIVLVRHTVDKENVNQQWSAEQLSIIMNKMQWGNSANFGVDYLALKHGMNLFSTELKRRGATCITLFQQEKSMIPFFSLEGHTRSIEIKFTSYSCPMFLQESDLLSTVMSVRDVILRKSNYPPSVHSSPSAVLGTLHFKPFKSPFYVEPEKKKIISKSPNKLGDRTIRKNRDKLISDADDSFGKKHSVFYLESALKKAKRRQDSEIKLNERIEINVENVENDNQTNLLAEDEIVENNNESDLLPENAIVEKKNNVDLLGEDAIAENNHIDLLAEDEIDDDIRVINALKDLPSKNVLFSEADQKNVLLLFDVVKSVAIERDYESPVIVAAEITEKALKSKSYYSTISARTIGRWFSLSEKEKNRSGRKINTVFEAEVWGNLMMCVFEKNEDKEVSYQKLITYCIYEVIV